MSPGPSSDGAVLNWKFNMAVLHRHSLLVITGLLYIAALHVKTTGAVSLVLLFPLSSP